MAMTTQYGVRITDRVQIVADPAAGSFVVKFDGEEIGQARSGPHGVRIAQDWLEGLQARREAEELAEKAAEDARELDEENCFLHGLASDLGVPFEAVERLLDIAVRRAKQELAA